MSYAKRLKSDVERWLERGVIDAATAERLRVEAERARSAQLSFGAILALMSAALLGAAILIFIAANWQVMPRLARVGMLFVIILAAYPAGAWLRASGRGGVAEAAWVLGACAFGASIALIGQMYHLSGDEADAVFIWGTATLIAAAALRSHALSAGAALLLGVWLVVGVGSSGISSPGLSLGILAICIVHWSVALWAGSRNARHLLLLVLYLFILMHQPDFGASIGPSIVLVLIGGALFMLGRNPPTLEPRIAGIGSNGLVVQGLVAFLIGIGLLQLQWMDEPGFMVPTIGAFAGIVAALLAEGRESRLLRRLCYAAFSFQLCFVYVVMFGSMLGTAGFFVAAGLALAALAFLIARIERRMTPDAAKEATT
jgi:uncharacterized membrane protein